MNNLEFFLKLLCQGAPASPPPAAAAKGVPAHQTSEPGEDHDSDDDDSKKNPNFARLITIRQVKPLRGTSLKEKLVNDEAVKRISLAESKVKEIAEECPELLVK